MNEFFKRKAKLGVITFKFLNHIFRAQWELWCFSVGCLLQSHTNALQIFPSKGHLPEGLPLGTARLSGVSFLSHPFQTECVIFHTVLLIFSLFNNKVKRERNGDGG